MNARAAYRFSELAIGGWRSGRGPGVLRVRNPYDGAGLAEIVPADVADVDAAFQAARVAQRDWAAALPGARAEVLRRTAQLMEQRHEEIVQWLIRESGSTRIKAEMEWGSVRAIVLEAATLPSRLEGRILFGDFPAKENRIYREPAGVVAVISPWNWPMHLSTRSVLPAIALGNAVVAKPANETPITGGLLFAKLLEEAGLPPGVLNVVVGESKDIGDAFVQHPVSRVVCFTGSTAVGRHIAQMSASGPMLKKVQLELGGNCPFVVLDDADLEQAVHLATVSKFLHQGQICMIANRIIVVDAVHDEFVERFIDRVGRLQVGDPDDPQTAIGPIIHPGQLAKLLAMAERAKADGARLRLGGPARGQLLPPQVFDHVMPTMTLVRNEIFGPIAPVIRAADEADALRLANDTDTGLSSAVITGDIERGTRFARQVQAGMTHVNDVSTIDMPTLPFGGEKNSGLGRFGPDGVIEAFTTQHWISVQRGAPLFPF